MNDKSGARPRQRITNCGGSLNNGEEMALENHSD
jgi:hypothetical protein